MSYPAYKEYKDSDIDWLGEVPEHWGLKRLRFVTQLNPSKQEIDTEEENPMVSFLPMESIGEDGSLTLDQDKPLNEVIASGYTYFRDFDVTIAKITPCFENGKGALMKGLTNGIGFGTTELIVVRNIENQSDPLFLEFLFRSSYFRSFGEFEMYGAGGQKRVPDRFVKNYLTGMPPVEEQKQIATFLDRETQKIDALIEEQQKLIELLQEKRQVMISHAVTKGLDPNVMMKPSGIEWLGDIPEHWELKPIKWITKLLQTGSTPPTTEEKYYSDGTLPWYGPGSFSSQLTVGEPVKYINEISIDEGKARKFPKGSIFVVGIGATLGKSALVSEDCSANQQIIALDFYANLIDSQYIALVISSFEKIFAQRALFTTMPIMNQTDLGVYKVPIPPLEEQNRIYIYVQFELEKLKELISKTDETIHLLKERSSSLISSAVTGKIDIRDQVEVIGA